MIQDFIQEFENTIQQFVDGVHTALPGVITAFDPAACTATVELKGIFKKPDGKSLAYPPAANVPVVFPQASGQKVCIAFPIKAGDGCLVVMAEQSLEAWKAGGESNLDLKHDLSNAIAIPGLFRTPNAAMQEAVSRNAIVIANEQTKVFVKRDKIEIKGDVFVDGTVTAKDVIIA